MRLMFVCTGNTCRSPLAVAAWRAVTDGQEGPGKKLRHVEVESAGIGALPGLPASPCTLSVAAEWGQDLSAHRSRPITPDLVQDVDLIIVMTEQQALAVQARCEIGPEKVRTLSSFQRGPVNAIPAVLAGLPSPREINRDILDPYGGTLETYRECGRAIREAVTELASTLGNGL